MKLPADCLIARIKITHYLLVPQAKGDKSAFLAGAGYEAANPDQLIDDIRSQVLPCNAVPLEVTEHGQLYQISCPLAGPNGRILSYPNHLDERALVRPNEIDYLDPRKGPLK